MLDSLHIKNFRCFEDLTIESLGRVNLIVGKNSVGKTTLLEAIDVLGNDGVFPHICTILKRRSLEKIENLFNSPDRSSIYIGNLENTFGIEIRHKDNTFTVKSIENSVENINIKEFHIEKSITEILESSQISLKKATSLQELFDSLNNAKSFIRLNSSAVYSSISPTNIKPEKDLQTLMNLLLYDDNLNDTGLKDRIIKWLKIINNKINNISFLKKQNNSIIIMINIDGVPDAIPLKSMGEGIIRLLQIFLLGFEAGLFYGEHGGFLLIDEFENGLHYSIQEEVWQKLFKLAQELDIQVFATTHSQDAIKTFCKVALASPEEGCLISLGKSAYGEDKGKIIAIVHNEADLQYILDTGMEVR